MRKGLDGHRVVEDKDEIRELKANLSAKAAAYGAYRGWCRPANPISEVVYLLKLFAVHGMPYHDPSASLATTTPLPNRPDPRKPALKTVRMARPFALARMFGGMILSGPNACFGSTKEARMLPAFLHSPTKWQPYPLVVSYAVCNSGVVRVHLLRMEAGRGLFMNGILTVCLRNYNTKEKDRGLESQTMLPARYMVAGSTPDTFRKSVRRRRKAAPQHAHDP